MSFCLFVAPGLSGQVGTIFGILASASSAGSHWRRKAVQLGGLPASQGCEGAYIQEGPGATPRHRWTPSEGVEEKVVSRLHLPGQMQPKVMMPVPGIAPGQPDWSGRRRRSPGKTDFPRGTPVSTWARHTLSTELCTPLPTAPSHQRLNSCWPNAEMEHNPTVLPPTSVSSACLLSVEHFSQRICLIREMRACRNKGKTVKGDQITLM